MTDDEWVTFKKLLCKYCEEDLDQWSSWKVSTKYGNVFIDITRKENGYAHDDLTPRQEER